MKRGYKLALCVVVVLRLFCQVPAVADINLVLVKTFKHRIDWLSQPTLSHVKIIHSGQMTLDQILQFQPGIQVTHFNGYGGSSQYSLSGFGSTANQNLAVIIDGHRGLNSSLNLSSLASIDPFNIQQVDIHTGSEGVLLGSGAVGGAIHIKTLPARQRQSRIQWGVGSDQTRQASVQLVKRQHDAGFYIQAHLLASHNYRQHNHVSGANVSAGMSYQHDHRNFRMDYQQNILDQQLPGALTAAQVNQNRRQSENSSTINHTVNHVLSSHYVISWHKHFRYQSQVRFNVNTDHGILSTPYHDGGHTIQVDNSLRLKWMDALVDVGVDYLYADYHFDNQAYHSQSTISRWGIFNQDQYQINRYTFFVGARWSQQWARYQVGALGAQQDSVWVSDVGVRLKLTPAMFIQFKRSGSFRFPIADEMAWTESHRKLQPQTGVDDQLSYRLHYSAGWLQLQLYDLSIKNEIIFLPFIDNQFFGYNTNLQRTRRLGAQGQIGFKWHQWQTSLGCDRVNPMIVAGDDRNKFIPFVSQWQLTLGLSYALSARWTVQSKGMFNSSRWAIGDTSNQGLRLPSLWLMDLTAIYHHQNFQLTATINNVWDHHYNAYATMQANHTIYYYPAPGINFYLAVNVSLGCM